MAARASITSKKSSGYFVYIVRCKDLSLYTGWTVNLSKRIALHNARRGAKYTRSRVPVQLVYSKKCVSKKSAMRQEFKIKQLSRLEKDNLIAG
jgi:putative endonuclease